MSAQDVNSLIMAGYPQEDTTLLKQAGDKITAARKQLGTLCGGDKETSRRGGNISRTMEDHIAGLGLDMGKEEDINTLCNIIGKAHWKEAWVIRGTM